MAKKVTKKSRSISGFHAKAKKHLSIFSERTLTICKGNNKLYKAKRVKRVDKKKSINCDRIQSFKDIKSNRKWKCRISLLWKIQKSINCN